MQETGTGQGAAAERIRDPAEMLALFERAEAEGRVAAYAKSGVVWVRGAIPGERVITVLDGVVETEATAGEDAVVIRGPKGEEYITAGAKFRTRYEVEGGFERIGSDWTPARAMGRCLAFRHDGPGFSFLAPWGEAMICEPGDMIAMPERSKTDDIYRIERGAFARTYTPL